MEVMQRLDDRMIIAPGPGDAAALAEVHVDSWRETYAGLLPDIYLWRMNPQLYTRRFRRQLMSEKPLEVMLAAEGRGGLSGYCAGHVDNDGRRAEVSTLYLLKTAQKLGLGRRLLVATARVLQARGADSLSLWVLDGNEPARGFYTHLGGLPVQGRAVQGWGGGFRETAFLWPDINGLTGSV